LVLIENIFICSSVICYQTPNMIMSAVTMTSPCHAINLHISLKSHQTALLILASNAHIPVFILAQIIHFYL